MLWLLRSLLGVQPPQFLRRFTILVLSHRFNVTRARLPRLGTGLMPIPTANSIEGSQTQSRHGRVERVYGVDKDFTNYGLLFLTGVSQE
jgi:hypothetical protein